MKLLKFIYLKTKDIFKRKKKLPFGIIAYVGGVGEGKTLSIVERLENTKKLYKNVDVKIYTNFGYVNQDEEIKSIEDIINADDNSIIAIDEVHTLFGSREWKEFPISMLSLITQNRKHSKQLLFTSQDFALMDVSLRRLCNYIVECKILSGRWVFQKAFRPNDYKPIENEFRPRHRAWRYSFIATDEMFDLYDTFKIIESIKQ